MRGLIFIATRCHWQSFWTCYTFFSSFVFIWKINYSVLVKLKDIEFHQYSNECTIYMFWSWLGIILSPISPANPISLWHLLTKNLRMGNPCFCLPSKIVTLLPAAHIVFCPLLGKISTAPEILLFLCFHAPCSVAFSAPCYLLPSLFTPGSLKPHSETQQM